MSTTNAAEILSESAYALSSRIADISSPSNPQSDGAEVLTWARMRAVSAFEVAREEGETPDSFALSSELVGTIPTYRLWSIWADLRLWSRDETRYVISDEIDPDAPEILPAMVLGFVLSDLISRVWSALEEIEDAEDQEIEAFEEVIS